MIQDNSDEILWHYTSQEAFLKIIETKTLHFGHWEYLNDPSEGLSFLKKIEEAFSNSIPKFDSANKIDGQIFKDHQDPLEKIIRIFKEQPHFLFSLSQSEDNLNLWSRYSAGGTGVAIGFDKNSFLKYLSSVYELDWGSVSYSHTYPIDTDDEIQEVEDWILKNHILVNNDSLMAKPSVRLNKDYKPSTTGIMDSYYDEITKIGRDSLMKKSGFYKSEEEYRYILFLTKELRQFGNRDSKVKFLKADLLPNGKNLRPIHKVDFSSQLKIINSLQLGPSNKSDLLFISSFMEENGFHHIDNITNSKGSYRS